MAAWVIWFVIAGILFIAEMLSITFYMLWLGIGAVVGGLIALFVPEHLFTSYCWCDCKFNIDFLYEKNFKNFRDEAAARKNAKKRFTINAKTTKTPTTF